MTCTAEELDRIGQAEELQLAPVAPMGHCTPSRPCGSSVPAVISTCAPREDQSVHGSAMLRPQVVVGSAPEA